MKFLGGTFGATSVAFSTTSTAAALPVTLEEVHRNLGVSETVTDLVVPLGASMYRAGSALFIPGDVEHASLNTGGETLRILYVFGTDSFEDVQYHFLPDTRSIG